MNRRHGAVAMMFGLGLSFANLEATQLPAKPAIPTEPIAAIIDAFKSHNIVALGEPHGNEQAHAVRLALLRDPRFPAVVNDIVWECGNARYQGVMDRLGARMSAMLNCGRRGAIRLVRSALGVISPSMRSSFAQFVK